MLCLCANSIQPKLCISKLKAFDKFTKIQNSLYFVHCPIHFFLLYIHSISIFSDQKCHTKFPFKSSFSNQTSTKTTTKKKMCCIPKVLRQNSFYMARHQFNRNLITANGVLAFRFIHFC